ncbi:hypothetical protein [Lysinibacillus sp. RS5]|uniref:hypothetical protein n=1 Tax=unclassified Lysinibacillus TaxID=2636778 RepID=UPI0035BEA2F1
MNLTLGVNAVGMSTVIESVEEGLCISSNKNKEFIDERLMHDKFIKTTVLAQIIKEISQDGLLVPFLAKKELHHLL